jgi:hypothetical protein
VLVTHRFTLIHSVIASEARQSRTASESRWMSGCDLLIFVAAAKRQFILSAAAGGVEGLLAMTDR